MDSFELNKILGAILFTCLVLLALNITAGALFTEPKPEKPGYAVAVPEHPSETAKGAAPAEVPIEQALASADPKRGEAVAKVCQTCHNLAKGAGPKIGPDLWDVVGRPKASVAGFAYSDALKSKGGQWSLEDLNQFLANPRGYAPGTKMTFAGLSRQDQRAEVIAYLNTLADSPKPLPTAKAAPAGQAQSTAGPPTAPPGQAPVPAPTQTPSPGQSQDSEPGARPKPAPGQKTE
jgi:cytochrome c